MSVNAGLRRDRAESRSEGRRYGRTCQYVFIPFPVVVPGSCVDAFRLTDAQASVWRNRASELGASWQLSEALTAFVSESRHFRNPNIDELALAAPDLHRSAAVPAKPACARAPTPSNSVPRSIACASRTKSISTAQAASA